VSDIREKYVADGFLHLREVFSEAELEFARQAVSHLPEWIRQHSGNANVQRLQPLQRCPAVADPAWIKAFYGNARLSRVVDEIFEDVIVPTPNMSRDFQVTGLLIGPREHWWSTGLHRDYRDLMENIDVETWLSHTDDLRMFNQINIPLHPDPSLWVIPGSHDRADTKDEATVVRARDRYRECQDRSMDARKTRAYRSELIDAMQACGGVNVQAVPGDLILYRSNILHCGIYEPAAVRMTLHDGSYSRQWHDYVLETLGHGTAQPG
jgi:hypothetical protein